MKKPVPDTDLCRVNLEKAAGSQSLRWISFEYLLKLMIQRGISLECLLKLMVQMEWGLILVAIVDEGWNREVCQRQSFP